MKGPDAKPSTENSSRYPLWQAQGRLADDSPVPCWQPHGEAHLGLSLGAPRPIPSTKLLVCPALGTAGPGFALQGLNNTARVLTEVGYAPQN